MKPPSPPPSPVSILPSVLPERTSSTHSSNPLSLTLIPHSTRLNRHQPHLPKAPVFIHKSPFPSTMSPQSVITLIDTSSTVSTLSSTTSWLPPRTRLYAFDDDFTSVAASDSTHPNVRRPSPGSDVTPPPSRPDADRGAMPPLPRVHAQPDRMGRYVFSDDFVSLPASDGSPGEEARRFVADRTMSSDEVVWANRRVDSSFDTTEHTSFAESFKRRISLHQFRPRLRNVGEEPWSFQRMSLRGRMGRGRSEGEDSIVKDWKQSARLHRAAAVAASSMTSENPNGCAVGLRFIARMFPKGERAGQERRRHRFDAGKERVRYQKMVEEGKVDDVQFISVLAYDEFMHSPNNRSGAVAKVFSRLRRHA